MNKQQVKDLCLEFFELGKNDYDSSRIEDLFEEEFNND